MNGRLKRRFRPPAAARPADWLALLGLIALGGSAFAFIRVGVESVPPAVVAVGRLWVGSAMLYLMMRVSGRRFPPLIVRTNAGPRLHLSWVYMLLVSLIGYMAPFFIFPWAQQYVDSGLAGVFMAVMPIWTLVLAYFFAGESMTPLKATGFGLGFIGVVILMGPGAIAGVGGGDMLAQAAMLFATFCYAVAVIISRRAPPVRPRVFACGTVLGAAVISTPALFFVEFDVATWTAQSLWSIILLGIGPTGLAGVLIIILIKRVSASYMALANYLIPIWAVCVGALLFGERLGVNVLIALAVILAGVALGQREQPLKPPPKAVT